MTDASSKNAIDHAQGSVDSTTIKDGAYGKSGPSSSIGRYLHYPYPI